MLFDIVEVCDIKIFLISTSLLWSSVIRRLFLQTTISAEILMVLLCHQRLSLGHIRNALSWHYRHTSFRNSVSKKVSQIEIKFGMWM